MPGPPVRPVVYGIYINGTQYKEFPLDAEIDFTWGQHDLFYIRYEYYRGLNLTSHQLWSDNAPVRIVWGLSGSTQVWYGYVNHHTVESNADSGSKNLQVTYTCIGTSKLMNSDITKSWGQVTGTYMAKTIAAKYGFRAVLSSTYWVLPSEIQANESDFHFLNRIADKIGYRFWVSGGTLYFLDPSVAIKGSISQGVPSFTMDKAFTYRDTVRNFQMLKGDNLPGSVKSIRSIYGIDKQSGQPFHVTATNASSSDISQIMTDWPVDTIAEASNLVNAWQSRSQFWQTATAELYGNTLVYPGKLISLTGIQMPSESSGLWLVSSAKHVLASAGTVVPNLDRYVTHVEILRNTTVQNLNLKTVTPVYPEFVTCNLYKGTWKSSSQITIYDGGIK